MTPEGWTIKTLGEIAKISSGGTPNRKEESYWGGSIPWVSTSEIQYKTIYDTFEKITSLGLECSSAKIFPKNTILIAMYGQGKTRGKVAFLGIEASTNQACAAIQISENFIPRFFYYFLEGNYNNIRNMANAGTQKNLNSNLIKGIQVPIPPLQEQQKIADILSTWDQAIATTEQLIANSQQRKKALMQKLLTGKKRLRDGDGQRFASEWSKFRLDDLALIRSGGTPKSSIKEYYDGDIPWVSIADMTNSGKWVEKTKRNISELGIANSTAYIYPEKTILFAMYGSIGKCSINKTPLSSSQAILGLMTNEKVNYLFLYFLLSSMESRLKLQAQQGTQPNLNAGMVKSINIYLPILEEQKAIADVLQTADQQIQALQDKRHHLQQEKKALMQQLLTGKKRVQLDEKPVATT